MLKSMERKGGRTGLRTLERQMENILKNNHLGWKFVIMCWVCTIPSRIFHMNIIELKFLTSTCFMFITSFNTYLLLSHCEQLWKFWILIFHSATKCIQKSEKKSNIFIISHLFTIPLNLFGQNQPYFSPPLVAFTYMKIVMKLCFMTFLVRCMSLPLACITSN